MDSISNLIIKIKNAGVAGKEAVVFPYSKMSLAICEALEKNGLIESVAKKGKKAKSLEIRIKYEEKKPIIENTKRLSKFSKRIYLEHKKIKPVRNKFGKMILSTSKGIMTDEEARNAKIGGEPLFEIW